jgi:RNA polymerase sigma factor (sigma-70 family)
MATKITADSLELTQEQEQELTRVWGLIHSIASSYFSNDLCISADDLIQEAAIRVTYAIRNHVIADYPQDKRDGYYVSTIHRSCLNQIRDNLKHYRNSTSLDYANALSVCDEDRLHQTLYIQSILDSVPDNLDRRILQHYYGLGAQPQVFAAIASKFGKGASTIKDRYYETMTTLRQNLSTGDEQ